MNQNFQYNMLGNKKVRRTYIRTYPASEWYGVSNQANSYRMAKLQEARMFAREHCAQVIIKTKKDNHSTQVAKINGPYPR